MKRFSLGIGFLLLVSGWLIWHAPSANAAAGFNVITSPLPMKLQTTPGKQVKTELRIKNQGDEPEQVKVGLMKFGASGEDGTPNLFNLGPGDSYASWVHFSPSEFSAKPGVWMTVTMTIDVPKDAALGYYLAVTFSPADVKTPTSQSALKGSVATLILLNVNVPNEKRTLSIADFSTDHGVYEYLPADFNIKLHNSGNIYVAPAGSVFIEKGGKTVATLDFNAAGGSVLPDSNRVFHISWADGFPLFKDRIKDGKPVVDDKARPKRDLTWDFSKVGHFRFGHYKAKLLAVYDDGTSDVPLEATVSFWVIPWKIMFVLLVILAVIGFGVFTLVRSIIRRARGGADRLRRHASKR